MAVKRKSFTLFGKLYHAIIIINLHMMRRAWY